MARQNTEGGNAVRFHLATILVLSFSFCTSSALAQGSAETEPVNGYGTVLLDGLTSQQKLIIDDEVYGDPTQLGPLILKSGLHLVELGQSGVPIRVVLKAGKTIRLVDHLSPHKTAGSTTTDLPGMTSAILKPSQETGGLLLSGSGAVALIVGFSFGLSALSFAADAEGVDRRELPRDDYDAIVRSAERHSNAANASFTIGTLALAGGLYLLYTDGYFAAGAD